MVVDSGPCHGDIQETLFGMADTLYLVTEMTFPSFRNAHRLISFLSARDGCRHLQVVANRFDARHGKIDGNSATKALTRPVDWKIPNAYAAVRAAQDARRSGRHERFALYARRGADGESRLRQALDRSQEGQPRVQPIRSARAAGTGGNLNGSPRF